jgi:AcrR family transcriptional regulator
MGIAERRAREREQRRQQILVAAWEVAESLGWARFSVEQVATQAELGRATVYGYFVSLDDLVVAMAAEALEVLSQKLAAAPGLRESLDVPVRFAQANPPAFALLFPSDAGALPFDATELSRIRGEARQLLARLVRLGHRNGINLPEGSNASAFISTVALAGAVMPELRASTTLRRRWQDFCLGEESRGVANDGSPETDPESDKK